MSNSTLIELAYWFCWLAYAILGVGGSLDAPGNGRWIGFGGGLVVAIMLGILGLKAFHHI